MSADEHYRYVRFLGSLYNAIYDRKNNNKICYMECVDHARYMSDFDSKNPGAKSSARARYMARKLVYGTPNNQCVDPEQALEIVRVEKNEQLNLLIRELIREYSHERTNEAAT